MYEHKSSPLVSYEVFKKRVIKNTFMALIMLMFSLFMGMVGYHFLDNLSWVDSLLDASMILTGMGPVHEMTNTASKLFASFYALYSGVAFLTTIAVFLAPVIHRFMHRFHLEEKEK
ncbi:MAG: hypothetical protein JSS90_08415 [Bacteroidetes bacterium]|jgi:hypothetical protein|nr:hypothetical protein [Bacteroidota bacterium]